MVHLPSTSVSPPPSVSLSPYVFPPSPKALYPANSAPSVPRAELISPLSSLSPPTPLPPPPPPPPGLPTYEQALLAPGVHDAPPPPYARYGAGLLPGGGAQRGGHCRRRGAGLGAGFGILSLLSGARLGGRGRGPAVCVCVSWRAGAWPRRVCVHVCACV